MRGPALVLAIVGVVAACGSFDESETTPPSPGSDGGTDALGGGDDGGRGGDTGASATPEKIAQGEGAITGLCASGHGVGWTYVMGVAGFVDGKLRPKLGMELTGGGCVVANLAIHYTDSSTIRSAYYDSDPPTEGSIAFGLTNAGPLTSDGSVYFTAELSNAKRIVETTSIPNQFPTLGNVTGTAKYIAANSSQVIVGTQEGQLQRVTRPGMTATKIGDVDTLRGLVLAGDTLYVASAATGAGAIKKCTPPSCDVFQDVAKDQIGPTEVTVSGQELYWLERDVSRVKSCTLPDCGNPRLVARLAGIVHLAVGDRIYMSDQDNAVWAIAK